MIPIEEQIKDLCTTNGYMHGPTLTHILANAAYILMIGFFLYLIIKAISKFAYSKQVQFAKEHHHQYWTWLENHNYMNECPDCGTYTLSDEAPNEVKEWYKSRKHR